jgi:hypothetical protein
MPTDHHTIDSALHPSHLLPLNTSTTIHRFMSQI